MSDVRLLYNLDLKDDYIWDFITPTQTAKAGFPVIQEIGYFPCKSGYYTERENLQSYLIKYCISGGGLLDYGGKTYRIKSGDIFWIDCVKTQYYRTDPTIGNWDIVWVHFYGLACIPYYNLFRALNSNSPVLHVGENALIKPLIERLRFIYKDNQTSLSGDMHAASLLTQLMIQCINSVSRSNLREGLPEHVIRIRDYIELHYQENISLDFLSSKFSLNKYYLQKLFKKSLGVTPNEYLMNTRIRRAKELLYETDYPISRIALDAGFNNIGHFIKLFKAHEGASPGAFRKQWFK